MNRRTSAWAAAHAQAGARLGGKALSLLLSLVLCLTLLPGAAMAADNYGFFINGTKVTADNISSFTTTGSISYENGTLTLDNATIQGTTDNAARTVLDCSYAVNTIELKGKNVINGAVCSRVDTGNYINGIYKAGALTIKGDNRSEDSLKITMPEYSLNVTATMGGIRVTGGLLTIEKCTMDVICAGDTAKNNAINAICAVNQSNISISIDDADVTAVIGKKADNTTTAIYGGTAIYAVDGALSITNSTVTAGAYSNRQNGAYKYTALEGKAISLTNCELALTGNSEYQATATRALHTNKSDGNITLTNCTGTLNGSDYGIHITGTNVPLAIIGGDLAITGEQKAIMKAGTSPAFTGVTVKSGENENAATEVSDLSDASLKYWEEKYLKCSKPEYSGTIAAPTVKTNSGGTVELESQTITGETVEFGCSSTGDASAVTNWQESTTFTNLTVGERYYFFARVEETNAHLAKVSDSTEVTIVAAPQPPAHDHCICGKDDSVPVAGHTHMTAPAWQPWDGDSELPTQTGYYYLTKDVTLTKTWTPPKETVLCLNGKTITANFDGSAITVQAPFDFTLTDCADTPGVVTHGTKPEGATYTGRGVEVQGKTTDGGVGAGFNMYGGFISGNTLTRDGYTQGGGVYAGHSSVLRMYGGSITGNRLICTLNDPTLALDSAEGGGVYARSTFELHGGSITGNSVEANYTAQGGGVYVAGRLHISGAPVIAGNTAVKSQQSTTNNYYGSSIAYILGTLANGTQIGVSQDSISSPFAAGWDTGTKYTLTSEDAAKFIPDDSGYTVKLDGNYLYLTKSAYTVTFHENGGTLTGKSTIQTGADGKLAALPSDPTRSGYTFDGWYTAATGGDQVTLDAVYTANTDLYAHWTRTGSSSGGSSGSSTYPVTAPMAENGSVTVSPSRASKGRTVTVTVTPDTGYVLESLTVLDQNGKELTLTDKGDGKYTFTMPAGKVEIKASFMEDNSMLNYFVDVKNSDYFYDAVLWAAKTGITKGINDTEFGPNQSCTRAQIVTFLWRAAGSPVVNYAMSMDDVNESSYYAEAVRWALSEGITGGVGGGRFDPNATCTREQAVAFLYRAAGSPAVSGGSAFSDVAANAYYADAVAWAEKHEITGGIGGGLFGSGNDCTRGQIVTLLYRAYSK